MIYKKWEIKNKKLLISTIIFIFLLIQFTFADLPEETSLEKWENGLNELNKNILQDNSNKYELRILKEFAKLRYPEINQDGIIKQQIMNLDDEDFISYIVETNELSSSEIKDLLSNFNKNEIKEKIITNNNETFVPIIVELNDFSDAEARNLLSIFDEDEIKNVSEDIHILKEVGLIEIEEKDIPKKIIIPSVKFDRLRISIPI